MDQHLLFVEGSPSRPAITHDHGHLDDGKGGLDVTKRQPPTRDDFKRLNDAKLFYATAYKFRTDLPGALAAYANFLSGKGASQTCDYDDFLRADASGRVVLNSVIEDACVAALNIFDKKIPKPHSTEKTDTFKITSLAVGVGAPFDLRYPMPSSNNWQKTMGAHSLWVSATVEVHSVPGPKAEREVKIVATLNAEDMYNFNPGAADMETSIQDSENGRLEIVGLAKEFLMTGAAVRKLTFKAPLAQQTINRVTLTDVQIEMV